MTKTLKPTALAVALTLWAAACAHSAPPAADMIVRIYEIEVHEAYVQEYLEIGRRTGEASVQREPGVIALFAMQRMENPTQFTVLEIYASREAYESHLKTPHFQRYKTTTLHMVKSLKLLEMKAIDVETMRRIFEKMR